MAYKHYWAVQAARINVHLLCHSSKKNWVRHDLETILSLKVCVLKLDDLSRQISGLKLNENVRFKVLSAGGGAWECCDRLHFC